MDSFGDTLMSALTSPLLNGAARQGFLSQPTVRNSADAQSTLANRLANRLGMDPASLSANREDYTPDKVSDRLLGFIEGRLKSEAASGADTEKMHKLLSQAREGIEKGFSDAKKILKGLGVLNGQIAEDVESTYKKITDGLDKLEKAYGGTPSAKPDSASLSTTYSERTQVSAQTFDLQVTTKDGDKVNISVARASADWSKSASARDASGSVTASESGQLQVGNWKVEVDGELSDDEKASLADLMDKVQDLSGKFFSGDLSGAFDKAVKLNLDGTQLASMSLNLTQTRMRQATDAYSEVAQQGGAQGEASSAVNGTLRDYAQSMLDALGTAGDIAADGKTMLRDLLKGGFALSEQLDQAQQDKAEKLNNSLLDGLQKLNARGSDKAALAS